jgi:hypothetical protein
MNRTNNIHIVLTYCISLKLLAWNNFILRSGSACFFNIHATCRCTSTNLFMCLRAIVKYVSNLVVRSIGVELKTDGFNNAPYLALKVNKRYYSPDLYIICIVLTVNSSAYPAITLSTPLNCLNF